MDQNNKIARFAGLLYLANVLAGIFSLLWLLIMGAGPKRAGQLGDAAT